MENPQLSMADLFRLKGVRLAAVTLADRINNPLAFAVGMLDMMSVDPNLTPDQKLNLKAVTEELTKAGQVVSSLSAVRRIVTEQTPVGEGLNLVESTKPTNPGHTEPS